MYRQNAYFQTAKSQGEIHQGLLATAVSARFDRLLAVVAYASRAGCKLINESFKTDVPGWRSMRKEWLISFDFGLTEPKALEYLANLPNSEVRIANAEGVLSDKLRPRIRFHNKVYVLESRSNAVPFALFSGSANLTLGGLYFNDEQAVSSSWLPPLNKFEKSLADVARHQKAILDTVFSSASCLSRDLLARYEAVWQPSPQSDDATKVVQIVSEPKPEMPLVKAAGMASAAAFWIDVKYVVENRGAGVPGNQIDLQRGSRVFFGLGVGEVQRNTLLGTIPIRYDGTVVECHMRFGNNQMDKLNLPIPGDPGPETYENQTLLFRRLGTGTFDLFVGSPSDVKAWKALSAGQRTTFTMRGGRQYGYFTA